MKRLPLLLFLSICKLAVGQHPVLVTPQWLNEHRNDPNLVVLYTGFAVRSDFDREHIEGSRFLWPQWLAFDSPDATMNMPDAKKATQVLQDLGINKNSHVVIYHKGTDVTIAARMFMALEHFGLKNQLSFLNGGLEAWKRAAYPVTNKASLYAKGNFTARIDKKVVDKTEVQAALSEGTSVVVDARAKRWYDGDATGNPRDGHITGALNIPFQDMLDSTNTIKPVEVVAQSFATVLADKNKPVILYCFIGQTACVDYLVGRSLGYDVKVYDGSMQEWSRQQELPMEKTVKGNK